MVHGQMSLLATAALSLALTVSGSDPVDQAKRAPQASCGSVATGSTAVSGKPPSQSNHSQIALCSCTPVVAPDTINPRAARPHLMTTT